LLPSRSRRAHDRRGDPLNWNRFSVVVLGTAVVVAVVAAVVAVVRPEPESRPPRCTFRHEPPQAVANDHRMKVQLGGRGAVTGITVGKRRIPMLPKPGGFSVRVAGGGRNLLPNPSFEVDRDGDGIPDGWRFAPGLGRRELTDIAAHSGRRSLRVSIPAEGTSAALATTIPVEPRTHYVVSAWFKSVNVQPTIPPAVREPWHRKSPVRFEVVQVSKGQTLVASAHGYTDTAEWNRQFVGFKTGPDVQHVRVRGLIRQGSGTAWFDDLSVRTLFGGGSVPVGGKLDRSKEHVTQHGEVAQGSLSVDAKLRQHPDHVRVDATVTTSSRRDIGLQVTYTLPINASGWQWADDARRTRTIEDDMYSSLSSSSLQRTSKYPFGAIFDRHSTVAFGVPLQKPRIFRIEYVQGQGLRLTFDLGLSRKAGIGPRADFSFVIFTADPSWGFRAVTQRYYELFPSSFVRRTDPACEGAWFVAPPMEDLGSSYRDFGLGLNMVALGKASSQSYSTWGTRYVKWDDDRGIYTSAYGHHWAFYLPIGSPDSPTPSYDDATARLQATARGSPRDAAGVRLRDEARAALRSTARDFNGRRYYERYGEFLAHYQILTPHIRPAPDWSSAVRRHQVERALRTAATTGGRLDGLHLDSTSGMRRWGAADDYEQRHWAEATIPLTFSYDSGLVTLRGVLALHKHINDLADYVHSKRMILSANFNADVWRTAGFIGADEIDYFGIEQGLKARANGGSADPFALWKRTLAYQRPISTLDARVGKGTMSVAALDRQLQQNLFYGIFAGAWDPKVEADGIGTGTKWTDERFADIWATYTPLFKELARAGWEPVTHARTSDPAVWVERFGPASRGLLLFTIRNETTIRRPYRMTIDLRALARGPVRRALARERVTDTALAVSVDRSGARGVVSDVVPPGSTRVVALDLRD
jgi:hypothetical protein